MARRRRQRSRRRLRGDAARPPAGARCTAPRRPRSRRVSPAPRSSPRGPRPARPSRSRRRQAVARRRPGSTAAGPGRRRRRRRALEGQWPPTAPRGPPASTNIRSSTSVEWRIYESHRPAAGRPNRRRDSAASTCTKQVSIRSLEICGLSQETTGQSDVTRPHRRRARIVQSYSPGDANMHANLIRDFVGPHKFAPPPRRNSISIGSSVFAGLAGVPDTHSHTHRYIQTEHKRCGPNSPSQYLGQLRRSRL